MSRFKAAALITINNSDETDTTPEEVLGWHADEGAWWSSSQHDESLFNGQIVFVRYAGTNEIIGQARVVDHVSEWAPFEDEEVLGYRYGFEFLDREPIRGVYLRDFGVTGWRARPGFVGLRREEAEAIAGALEEARSGQHEAA